MCAVKPTEATFTAMVEARSSRATRSQGETQGCTTRLVKALHLIHPVLYQTS